MKRHRHLMIKALLILVAESVAMGGSWLFSTYIHPIEHTLRINVVVGALLAVIVVLCYNRYLWKKKAQVEKELKDLQVVVLKKVPESEEDTK